MLLAERLDALDGFAAMLWLAAGVPAPVTLEALVVFDAMLWLPVVVLFWAKEGAVLNVAKAKVNVNVKIKAKLKVIAAYLTMR